ncbi:MAG: 5-formyltetrahydrofolate cyclo-ligase [Nitrospirae bacterium]|nr:5-formyltetrahydrofolate cyclo-ligase [Nitrospirota bacterium]
MRAAANNKNLIRKEVLSRRDSIKSEIRNDKDGKISRRLQGLYEFEKARAVLLYASFRSEVDTFNLLKYCLAGKKVAVLPRVDTVRNDLRLYKIMDMQELTTGYLGIPEPNIAEDREMDIEEMDLIVVPGVAFDLKCNRLGYGKGFYDRLLSQRKASAIALAFEEQILESIPSESHDIKMDKIITDKRIIDCRGR